MRGYILWLLKHFNPRSPCGERLYQNNAHTHAIGFQPTLPVRGATSNRNDIFDRRYISTHAPRAGSDQKHTIYQRNAL